MAGAMAKRVAIAGMFDDATRGLVNFPALQRLVGVERRANFRNAGVTGPRDDREHLADLGRDVTAGKGDTREVAINRARPIALGPQIDEHEAAFGDHRVLASDRLVVRIAAVGTDGTDRRMIAD